MIAERERVQRTGGSAEMTLREMQVDGGLFQIVMSQQHLDGARVCAGFQQMSGEAVAQRMRVNPLVLESGALSGMPAGLVNDFGGDGLIGCMMAPTREQPD